MSFYSNLSDMFPSLVSPPESDASAPPIVFEGPDFVPVLEPTQPSIFRQIEGVWKAIASGVQSATGGKIILPRPEDRMDPFFVPGYGTTPGPLPPPGATGPQTSYVGLLLIGAALLLAVVAIKR
jgi:hypothetical protein